MALVAPAVFLIITFLIAYAGHRLAARRGRNSYGWAFACALLPPALLLLALLPSRMAPPPDRMGLSRLPTSSTGKSRLPGSDPSQRQALANA